MGSIKKLFNSPERRVARGEGRMVDGNFVEYTAADKEHINKANANKNAAYTDIAAQSMLGRYSGDISSEEGMPKKKKMAISTLLGGSSVLGG